MFNEGKDRIEYGGAMIGFDEVKAVMNVMLSQGGKRWTVGPESQAFEEELAAVAGVKRAVVVNSGSSALLLALKALQLPPESFVLIPACNFPTAYNAILLNGHVPVVIDIDPLTLNLDLQQVKTAIAAYPEIKAVIAVNIAGNSVDLPALRKIIGEKRFIILDNCDGFGTTSLAGKFVEQYADLTALSFHAAHIITTGEGGAVLTNSGPIANRIVSLREWGRASGTDKLYSGPGFPDDYRERYVYEEIGYNLKPLELQCAMGRVQLKRLAEFKAARKHNYNLLAEIFSDKAQVIKPTADICWFSFPLLTANRKRWMAKFESHNIETRTIFSGNILRHPAYDGTPRITIGDLPQADRVMREGMFLSVHPSLTSEMINYIAKVANSL